MQRQRMREGRKRVSRVLFLMVISLGTQSLDTGHVVAFVTALDFWPRRATVFGGQFGDCCREDCPFHSTRRTGWHSSLLLSQQPRLLRQSGLSTGYPASPAFTGHPALRSSDFPLTRRPATILLPTPRSYAANASLVKVPPAPVTVRATIWCRRGDLNSHALTSTTP